MASTTKARKAKGRSLQNWVRDRILFLFPSLTTDDVSSNIMGNIGEDVRLSPAARKLFPYSVECKNNKAFAIYKHFKQAQANAGPHTPLLIVKQNRDTPLVIMDAEVFFEKFVK